MSDTSNIFANEGRREWGRGQVLETFSATC